MTEYFTKDGDEFKKVDENLLTQTDVDKVVESRLERQKKQYADYDTLKETAGKVETIKSEYEDKLKEVGTKVTTLETDLGKAKLETEKVKIVHEFQLSDDLAEFVEGETAEEMRKRAEKLAKGVTPGTVKIDKKPKPGEETSQSQKIAQGLFGRKSD